MVLLQGGERINSNRTCFTLITEHERYKALGKSTAERQAHYKTLFEKQVDKAEEITRAAERGEVYGGQAFHDTISRSVDRPTRLTKHGGDRKSAEYKDQVG